MKLYKRIIVLIGIIAAVPVWADQGFLKAGIGAGFDSNIFGDGDNISGIIGNVKLAGEGVTDGELFKLHGGIAIDAEANPYYFLLDASAGAGMILTPDIYTLFRVNAGYNFRMYINHSLDIGLIIKRDLGTAITADLSYGYQPVFSLSGTSNESVLGHSVNGGLSIALADSLSVLAHGGYGIRNYFELPYSGDILRNRNWAVECGILLLPDYDTSVKAAYSYTSYLSSSQSFTVYSTTNMLYLYNDAEVHSIALEAGLDIGFDVSFRLMGKIDFIRLIAVSQYETAYLAVLKTDIFLDPSWKMEIPITFSGMSGAVSQSYARLKAGVDIFYLF
ncbi:MAG: hypothetical protein A2Y33_14725 [Spirochaetes bacterium GWF1_51_8]|nr:MAG: hypothetical protein A2Y33_14725 [Spirochaetes bacterium GWF1_51_8]